MSGTAFLGACAGAGLVAGVVLIVAGLRTSPADRPAVAGPPSRWVQRLRAVRTASRAPGR